MAIRTYLVKYSTDIPVTINDKETVDGDFFQQIISKAQAILDEVDMNNLTYSLSVISHTEESIEDFGN